MSEKNYFCIFCKERHFFKRDLRDHIHAEHKSVANESTLEQSSQQSQQSRDFDQLVESLVDYCSELEITVTKPKRRKQKKKFLPEKNVNYLLIGCRLCDQIIDFYKLKSFDTKQKPNKDLCICGDSSDDNNLTLIVCKQCHHSYHFECITSTEYSGQDLNECMFCKTRDFTIESPNDVKPLDQLSHYRQHIDYRPYRCIVKKCDQKFHFYPLFVQHIKSVHKMTDEMIAKSKSPLFRYEKIVEIEELLERKGIKSELITIGVDYNQITSNNVNEINANKKTNTIVQKKVIKTTAGLMSVTPSGSVGANNNSVDTNMSSLPSIASTSQSTPTTVVTRVSVPTTTRRTGPAVAPTQQTLNENLANTSGLCCALQSGPGVPAAQAQTNAQAMAYKIDLLKDLPKDLLKVLDSLTNLPVPQPFSESFFTDEVNALLLELERLSDRLTEPLLNKLVSYLSTTLPTAVTALLFRSTALAIKDFQQRQESIVKQIDSIIKGFDKNSSIDDWVDGLKKPICAALEFQRQIGARRAMIDIKEFEDQYISNVIKPLLPDYMSEESIIAKLIDRPLPSKANCSQTNASINKTNGSQDGSDSSNSATNNGLESHSSDPIASTSSENVCNQNETNASDAVKRPEVVNNYSIPKNKLPNDLSQDLVEAINKLIKKSEGKRNLFDSISETNYFEERLKRIEKKCLSLPATHKTQIHLYLSSNLPFDREVFMERVHTIVAELLDNELESAIRALRQYVSQLSPEVLKSYEKSVKEFEHNKQKGIPSEQKVVLKSFPWTESIRNKFNHIISCKMESFDLILANDPTIKSKDFVYDFLQSNILPIWPNGWMKVETLVRMAKPVIKQKSPVKAQTPQKQLNSIPINTNQSISCYVLTNTTPKSTQGLTELTQNVESNPSTGSATDVPTNKSTAPVITANTGTTVGLQNRSTIKNGTQTPTTPPNLIAQPVGTRDASVLCEPTSQSTDSMVSNTPRLDSGEPQIKRPRLCRDFIITSTPVPVMNSTPKPTQPKIVSEVIMKGQEKVLKLRLIDASNASTLSQANRSIAIPSPVLSNARPITPIPSTSTPSRSTLTQLNGTDSSATTSATTSSNASANRSQNAKVTINRSKFTSSDSSLDQNESNILNFKQWMTGTKLDKFPYFPQLDDIVVYLRSAHYHYMTAMREREYIKGTRMSTKTHNYSKRQFKHLDTVFAIVREIVGFESKPLYSIKLKLEEVEPESEQPMQTYFELTYTILPDVSEFLMLKQTYQKAIDQRWQVGDDFMTAVMDCSHWMFGSIINEQAFSSEFPNSLFKKFRVEYISIDSMNTDIQTDLLSPWDLEKPHSALDSDMMSRKFRDIYLAERMMFYQPVPTDWTECYIEGDGDCSQSESKRDMVCAVLSEAFNRIMRTPVGKQFTAENDPFLTSESKPIYPINLTRIKTRIDNRFYRRSTQIKFDLEMIEKNIEMCLWSEDLSDILSNYVLIRKVCVQYIDADFWQKQKKGIMSIYNEVFGIQGIEEIENNDEVIEISDLEVPEAEVIAPQNQTEAMDTSAQQNVPQMESCDEVMDDMPINTEENTEEKYEIPAETEVQTNGETVDPNNENESISRTECLTQIVKVFETEATNCETQTDLETISEKCDNNTQTESQINSQIDIQTQTDFNIEFFALYENQMDSSQPSEPSVNRNPEIQYLCVFCDTNSSFVDRSQALEHYRHHLGVVIRCEECYANFPNVRPFRTHNTDHSQSEKNLLNIKHFFLALNWIDSFLDFQSTEVFQGLNRIRNEYCLVCIALNRMRAQSSQEFNELENREGFEAHIRSHLNYNGVYECNQCSEPENEDQKHSFYFGINDAKKHLCLTHDEFSIDYNNVTEEQIQENFKINHILNPHLEMTVKDLLALNDSIRRLFDGYSID